MLSFPTIDKLELGKDDVQELPSTGFTRTLQGELQTRGYEDDQQLLVAGSFLGLGDETQSTLIQIAFIWSEGLDGISKGVRSAGSSLEEEEPVGSEHQHAKGHVRD